MLYNVKTKKSKGIETIFQNNIFFLTEEVSQAVKRQEYVHVQ